MSDLYYDRFGIRYQDIDELIPEFEGLWNELIGMMKGQKQMNKVTKRSGKCRVIAECADLTNKINQTIYQPTYIKLSADTLAKLKGMK